MMTDKLDDVHMHDAEVRHAAHRRMSLVREAELGAESEGDSDTPIHLHFESKLRRFKYLSSKPDYSKSTISHFCSNATGSMQIGHPPDWGNISDTDV
jgi:hypothetical protein